MLFNSLQFLVFFPVVTTAYFILPFRFRWVLLLAASCLFYMAFVPSYILILGGTIIVDYIAGILIEKAPKEKKRPYLALSIVSNVAILAVFKYADFAIDNVNALLAFGGASAKTIPGLRIVLPLGLSFHTFQAMSYTIEVYRGRQKAERHFGIYALYVMFYPQLVAGPIERPQNILKQLKTEHHFDYDRVKDGLILMAWGMFQKVVIADRLAMFVNPIFAHPRECHGLVLVIGAVAFTFEIFFDFAGYSDIALGAAQVMGVKLMVNFKRPFFSKTTAEFWNRWHISLSTWFRDYLFLPLTRKRRSKAWLSFSTMVVFVLSGLWHGASWNFVAWGALHGTFLVCGALLAPHVPTLLADNSRFVVRLFNVLRVFGLVCIASVFFRAEKIGDAFYMLRHIPDGLGGDLMALAHRDLHHAIGGHHLPGPREWVVVTLALTAVLAVHLVQRGGPIRQRLAVAPVWLRWPAYAALTYACILIPGSEPVQFIYFQF
jgi:D-alanyl-lipoteichoic acid acyltransferase DltB (MBOAT superfamily)